ncbi:MAG: EamA family transporter, partial [Fusobacterium sp.]
KYPKNVSEKDILEKIKELNKNDEISGILVQLPLPSQISKKKIINAIHPSKDVDGFNPMNVGNLSSGYESSVPCTPLGCYLLIKKIEPKALGTLIFRSSFGTLGILCNYYAVDHLLLSDATMLLQLSPFFAIVFSFLILKERVVTKQMLIVIFAFIGALFVIKPSFTSMSMIPSLAGVCGGMFAGLAYTYVRKLGGMGMAGPFIVFFFSAFSCLSILPFAIMSYVPMSTSQIIYLLFAGLFACGGQFTMTTAYYSAPAKDISVYNYSSIIFAAILGFTFLGQIPDIYSIIGYIIILLMAYTMFKFNQNK